MWLLMADYTPYFVVQYNVLKAIIGDYCQQLSDICPSRILG